MFDFADSLMKALSTGEAVILSTVIGPRELGPVLLGCKLLVWTDGRREGSLGAPSLDERVAADVCQRLSAAGAARVLTFSLSPDERAGLGLGAVADLEIFVELMLPPPTLLIVGAGHIAHPLSRIGKMLDFQVAVLDDRPSLANQSRFPEADRVIAGYYGEELSRFPITPATYIVLVTRGHRHDEESLRQVIASPAAYIGMIGSRRRVSAVFQHLREEGVPAELIERVCSPIGLDVGAETPEEIAVSILAEIVNWRRRGQRHPASLSAGERHRA